MEARRSTFEPEEGDRIRQALARVIHGDEKLRLVDVRFEEAPDRPWGRQVMIETQSIHRLDRGYADFRQAGLDELRRTPEIL
jgi:hypothetical protein